MRKVGLKDDSDQCHPTGKSQSPSLHITWGYFKDMLHPFSDAVSSFSSKYIPCVIPLCSGISKWKGKDASGLQPWEIRFQEPDWVALPAAHDRSKFLSSPASPPYDNHFAGNPGVW